MKMTPAMLIIGGLLIFWASTYVMVFIPIRTMHITPSEIWRPMTDLEAKGHRLFVQNGCSYCHSQFIRVNDWGHGAERIAEAGDYEGRSPALVGTERTGPDLSMEGGQHPDDWHLAHFLNPRYTSPISVMPSWAFLGQDNLLALTAYVQFEGMKYSDPRVARQKRFKELAVQAYQSGPDSNIAWLHSWVPPVWRPMPNPYPPLESGLLRGKRIYQEFCIGCHGAMGDGRGPAAPHLWPPPLDFTQLRRNLVENRYIGGIIYYQVMNGITGTAMPYFKRALESEKIWDLANYISVSFIGYSDGDIAPRGIDAAYEPEYVNPFVPPDTSHGSSP